MHVELIEHLRCPESHAESPLVAAATRSDSRRIVNGVLGCPVCGTEYRIEDGVARFTSARSPAKATEPSMDMATRIAAFLALTDARGFAVLVGAWGAHAAQLTMIVDTRLLLVNPPGDVDLAGGGAIVCADAIPLASGLARAAALDAETTPPLAEQLRVVRAGGRLLAPVSIPLPDGVREIARDERHWIGEKEAAPRGAPRLVTLERKRQG